jgi:hypothetical protein
MVTAALAHTEYPRDMPTPDVPDGAGTGAGSGEALPRKEETRCLRCRQVVPVDEDGFCERCLREIDQACL